MTLDPNRLENLISTLTSRPGHETVRSLVRELCVVGLDVPDREIDFEVPIPMVRGRIDALLGETIFEFKRDLRRESGQACEQLERYLSERERVSGRRYLGIRRAEALWNEHGTGQMALSERLNYHGSLTVQFPIQPIRVVYTKSGATLVAAVVRNAETIIDHKLYWASCGGENEAHYLTAIFNSDTFINRIRHLQSRGHGPRDFDKVLFALPFPRFSADIPLHLRIAECGRQAEARAVKTPLREGMPFPSARQAIRKHLTEAGVAAKIEAEVSQLLDGDA